MINKISNKAYVSKLADYKQFGSTFRVPDNLYPNGIRFHKTVDTRCDREPELEDNSLV